MKEFVDITNDEKLGVEYTPEERETALAAVRFYRKQLLAGYITPEAEVMQRGVEVCDTVEALICGGEIIEAKVHEILQFMHLAYIVRMHEGLPVANYGATAEVLGIKAYDLFRHGMTARRMIDGKDTEIVPIA